MKIGIDASRGFVSEPTGTERYSYEVISRMVDLPEAKDVEFVLYSRDEQILNSDWPKNVQIRVISRKKLWTQIGLAMATWKDQIDVLWIPAHTLPVLRNPKVKTVVTIHGIEYEWLPAYENKLQRWYLPLSTQYAVKTANKIIAVSGFTKTQLIQRLGAEEKKIQVVYEGYVGSKEFNIGQKQVNEILNKYKIEKHNYLLFIGTVQPRKNLKRLIEAFKKVSFGDKSIDCKLVIAGKLGWLYEEVLETVKREGLEERVVFTGYITEAERETLLHYAIIYVQPSITEGFGLPVLEAWAAGLGVISSNGGALSEIVSNFGLLFDPLKVEEMADMIEKVMKDEKLRKKLVGLGEERLKDFSWDMAAKQTFKLLLTYN